jgi:membrane dipeptidase
VISLRRRANGEGVHGCFGPVVVPRAADVGIGTDGTILRIELSKAYAESQRNFYTDRVKRGISTSGESADVFNLIPEYNTPRRFKTLADDLSRRGWPSARIDKILGANFARLFSAVWTG